MFGFFGFSFGCGVNTVQGGGTQDGTKIDVGTTETCDKDADCFLCANDCDDDNALMSPLAVEGADTIDNTCNDTVD